eukprot:4882033-Karenia_brevis.AAC.1
MEAVTNKALRGNYAVRKAAWKMRGGFACDHGVLFNKEQTRPCPCMQACDTHSWQHARWMASLDERTKRIGTQAFN